MEFVYTNINPFGAQTDDCVTRAISLVSGYDYFDIQEKLYLVSRLFECDRLDVCCYQNLLERVFGYEPVYCHNMTIEEFADEHPLGIFLIRIPNHLTVIIDGKQYDTFYSGEEVCDRCWFVG